MALKNDSVVSFCVFFSLYNNNFVPYFKKNQILHLNKKYSKLRVALHKYVSGAFVYVTVETLIQGNQ